jgi:hypothetical protein
MTIPYYISKNSQQKIQLTEITTFYSIILLQDYVYTPSFVKITTACRLRNLTSRLRLHSVFRQESHNICVSSGYAS